MDFKLRGKVHEGSVIFEERLNLADGTEVLVKIEPVVEQNQPDIARQTKEFMSLPFFGMFADREDMQDSVAWVNKEREKWHQRSQRQD